MISMVPMSSFVEDASGWISLRRSEHTRTSYARDLALWVRHRKEEGADPEELTELTVAGFVRWMERAHFMVGDKEEVGYAPLSQRRTLSSLAAMFAAKRPGQGNPFALKNLWPAIENFDPTEAVSDSDARLIIAAAAGRGRTPERDGAILHVLRSTGMRRVSVASVLRRGVLARGGVMSLRHILKGGEQVESELSEEAAEAVAAWLNVAPKSEWLFCALNGDALSPQAITSIVAAASKSAGIHVHPHQFRAAAITEALDAGIPLERVRAFVHHKDIRSTLRYDRGARGAGVAAEVASFRAKKRTENAE
jgi:integrase/recombinase XerD